MSCPTCSNATVRVGATHDWCPHCGTLFSIDGYLSPVLVHKAREFEKTYLANPNTMEIVRRHKRKDRELGTRYLRLLLKYQPHDLLCDRASGEAICEGCGLPLFEHEYFNVTTQEDMVFNALAIDCEGRVWKL